MAVANQHAPIIEKKIRGIQTPWMTGHIKYVMHQRDYYLNKAKKSELQEDWKMYRSFRNQVTLLIRKAKCNYNKKLIDDNSDNPKNFWKTINKILPNSKNKSVPSVVDIEGKLILNKAGIANAFNSYFTETVRNLVNSMGNALKVSADSFLSCVFQQHHEKLVQVYASFRRVYS